MKNKKFINILTIILLSAGVLLLFYPAINNIIFVYNQKQVIDSYNSNIVSLDSQMIDEMKTQAKEYNDTLSSSVLGEQDLSDNTENVSGNLPYSQLLNVEDELIGYIVIEKIGLNQPIFHGTEDETLEKGIGHMENTSLPLGGENTHCVLTGHTGVPGMMLFTDLDKMEKGDCFYIKILDEVLKYEVDDIKVVLPNITEHFKIEEGRDLVTLVTCTPYGVNTHRLLVRGSRVPYNGEIDVVDEDSDNKTSASTKDSLSVQNTKRAKISNRFVIYYIVTPALICTIILLLVLIIKKRRRKKAENSSIVNNNLSEENEG